MNPTYKGRLACEKMYTRESSESLHAACTHIDQPMSTGIFGRTLISEPTPQNAPVTKKRTFLQIFLMRNPVVIWDANAEYENLTKTYEASNPDKLLEQRDLRYGILFGDPLIQYFQELTCIFSDRHVPLSFMVNLCPVGIDRKVAFAKSEPTNFKEWNSRNLEAEEILRVQWIINPTEYFATVQSPQLPILDSEGNTLDYPQSPPDDQDAQNVTRRYSQNDSRDSSRDETYTDPPRNPYTPGVHVAPRSGPQNQQNEYIIHERESIVNTQNTHVAVVPLQSQGNDNLVKSLEDAHQ